MLINDDKHIDVPPHLRSPAHQEWDLGQGPGHYYTIL